jgi:hypothetical protein
MAEFQFQYDAMNPNASGGLQMADGYKKNWQQDAFDTTNTKIGWGNKTIGMDPFGIMKGLLGGNKDKWYRDYRKWAGYWRTGMSNSMGYGAGGEEAATDPLSKLQFALTNQVDMGKIKNTFDQNYDASGLVNSRNQGLAAMLRQQAAGMGVNGAYDATINNASNARQTLIDKSMAAYRPEAYQQQQTLSSNADQLLQSIQMANLDAQKSLTAAGRTV